MFLDEHFLFFPAIVLIGLILIILSFRLLVRLFFLFLVIFGIWYGIYALGLAPSPIQVYKDYRHEHTKKAPYAQSPIRV